MRNWRIISTIAAVVLAAVAGVLVWKYVTSADTRAEHNKGFVSALVAKSRIARGTAFDTVISDHLFTTVKIPRDSLPPDRILPDTDAKLLVLYKGRGASTDIFTGTPVVSQQFVGASQLVNTVAGAIPRGKEAITVSLDATHAVGGFVTPGDRVNILLNTTIKDATDPNSEGVRTTAFLLPGIKVLAVGSTTVLPPATSSAPTAGSNGSNGTTTTTTPQSQPNSLITLLVTPRQAEQIVQGTTVGTAYLSLNPPDFTTGQFQNPQEIVEAINLFDQPLPLVQSTLATLKQNRH